jgi:CheY-like chemotaxis protein
MHAADSTRGAVATVLLVDDDDDLREVCADVLRGVGYDVVGAASGAEALRLATSVRPALVITDLNMPEMNGIDLCRRLHEAYAPPAPVVIVMSAVAAAEPAAHAAGAAGFIVKPFTLEELLAQVRAALGEPIRFDREAIARAKAQERESARAVAEASFVVSFAREPIAQERASRVARWLGAFYEPASVALLVPHDGQLEIGITSDERRLPPASRAPDVLASIGRSILETGSSLVVSDLATQPWHGTDAGRGFRSIVGVPFRLRDVPVAVLCVNAPGPRQFGAADLALLELLASRSSASYARASRTPVVAPSGLIGREAFRRLLEIEATGAADRHEGIALALLRTRAPLDRTFGPLLERIPSPRMLLGELYDDVVAVAVRAEHDEAKARLEAGATLVRSHADVAMQAEVFVGSPLPLAVGRVLLDWAEHLLAHCAESSSSFIAVAAPARESTTP